MKRALLIAAFAAALLATTPNQALAQGKPFGDFDNLINPEDEIFYAYIFLSYAYTTTGSVEILDAMNSVVEAYLEYRIDYIFAVFRGFSEFYPTKTNLLLAISGVMSATTAGGSATGSIFGNNRGVQSGTPLIDGLALQRALLNVGRQPGYLANHGSSNIYAWWGLWFLLYAYSDVNAIQAKFGG